MGCILSLCERRDEEVCIAARRVACNYLVLRNIFGRLDLESLSRCASALPRDTEWGAAVAAERQRKMSPKLFALQQEEEHLLDNGKLSVRERRRRLCGALKNFVEGKLEYEPALALTTSRLLGAQAAISKPSSTWARGKVAMNVPGVWFDVGAEVPSPRHAAMFFPPVRGMTVIPFSLSMSEAASDKPILSVVMGRHYADEASNIRCLLLFTRKTPIPSLGRFGDITHPRLTVLVKEVDAAVGKKWKVPVAGHELDLEGDLMAYGLIFAGSGFEACSAMMNFGMNGYCPIQTRVTVEALKEAPGMASKNQCALVFGEGSWWKRIPSQPQHRDVDNSLFGLFREVFPG